MRLAILCSELAGYMLSCWKALHDLHGVELLVYCYEAEENAPFQFGALEWIRHRLPRRGASVGEMTRRLAEFKPDAVFMSGWMDNGYLAVARAMRRQNVFVIAGSDGQWRGTLRQHVGTLTSPLLLKPSIDVLWAAGERQVQFARRLGFHGQRCWRGVYCCDWEKFAHAPDEALAPVTPAFLFVGRYVAEKGIGDLLDGYREYRRHTLTPWDLVCVGTGPLASILQGQPGVKDLGFVQPDHLPAIFKELAGVFVLPSRVEPWGVVVQEAAASGLPLICSEACGAGVHLLQEGFNGWLFDTGDTEQLAACLHRAATTAPAVLRELGRRSHQLSRMLTPSGWADKLIKGVAELKGRTGA